MLCLFVVVFFCDRLAVVGGQALLEGLGRVVGALEERGARLVVLGASIEDCIIL